MKKLYRLKKEAVQFYNPKHAKSIYEMPTWIDAGVYESALEEVEKVFIKSGIKRSEMSSDLSGWSDNTTQIHFTIEIRGVSYQDSDKIVDSINVRGLMDKFQKVINDTIN